MDAPNVEEPQFYDLPDGEDSGSNSGSDDPEQESAWESEDEVEEDEIESEHRPSFLLSRTAALRAALKEGELCSKVKYILAAMEIAQIDLPIFLHALSWGDSDCIRDPKVRSARTSLMHSIELPTILEHWWKPPKIKNSNKARPKGGLVPMELFAATVTRTKIEHELKLLGPVLLTPKKSDIDEEELTGVSLEKLTSQIQESAPHLWSLIHGIAASEKQQAKNTHKSPTKVVLATIAILSYARSHNRNRLQKLFSIYFKFRGLSAKGFDTLHALGVTMSNKWTGNAVGRISKRAMDTVVDLMGRFPWLLSYDNIALSFRVFSQRIDHQSQSGHGTAATVYVARHAKPLSATANADYRRQRAIGMKNPISAMDIFTMSIEAAPKLTPHFDYNILRTLLNAPDFDLKSYKHHEDPLLAAPPRIHGLPWGPDHVHLQYLLSTVGIPEASYEDNAQLIGEWLKQLRLGSPAAQHNLGLSQLQIWVGDQLTADRLRTIANFRSEDFNSFQRLEWMIVERGWLHVAMCIVNSLHKQHLGTGLGRGLSAVFDLLNRKGLGRAQTQGAFFHDLDEVLSIVFEAQIRELWLQVAGVHNLADLRQKSPRELVELATKIRRNHASTEALTRMRETERTRPEHHDEIKFQSVLFLRDVLQYIALRYAMKHGDVGLMECMLPELIYRFAGGKNSNYFGEMLELVQGLKREWPDELREFITSNCWLVNFSGRRNTFLGVDMAQEHNIKDIKAFTIHFCDFILIIRQVTHRSQGPSVDWKYLFKLHPTIHLIRAVAEFMESEFETDTRGKKHTVPKREQDIRELQQWYRASNVHKLVHGREIGGNAKKDIPKDYIKIGQDLLATNKKIEAWVENRDFPRSEEQDWASFGPDSDEEE